MILTELGKIMREVEESELTRNEKQYLRTLLTDNLRAISANINLQLRELRP
jgi:hypothetical protein